MRVAWPRPALVDNEPACRTYSPVDFTLSRCIQVVLRMVACRATDDRP
jgi:hypothetical protein